MRLWGCGAIADMGPGRHPWTGTIYNGASAKILRKWADTGPMPATQV